MSNAARLAVAVDDCSDARLRVPASVNASVPLANSNTASVMRAAASLAGLEPAQPSRDHQVQHQEQVAFEGDDDALAEAPTPRDALADDVGDRRHRGAQHERTGQPDALEALAGDALARGFDVDRDVGQLGHVLAAPQT